MLDSIVEGVHNTLKIMMIDDDADDRELFLSVILEIDSRIECNAVSNVKKAMETLVGSLNNLPDIIFLDIRMPGYDGKKCLLDLKTDLRFRNIPVVIYTTSSQVEEANELIKFGAFYFITKPTDIDDIYYQLSYALELQRNTPINEI